MIQLYSLSKVIRKKGIWSTYLVHKNTKGQNVWTHNTNMDILQTALVMFDKQNMIQNPPDVFDYKAMVMFHPEETNKINILIIVNDVLIFYPTWIWTFYIVILFLHAIETTLVLWSQQLQENTISERSLIVFVDQKAGIIFTIHYRLRIYTISDDDREETQCAAMVINRMAKGMKIIMGFGRIGSITDPL